MLSQSNYVPYLCNFDVQNIRSEDKAIDDLWTGVWTIDNIDLCKELLTTCLDLELLICTLKSHQKDGSYMENVLRMAISSYLTFCEKNWTPHPEKINVEEYLGVEWPSDVNVMFLMQRDSEPLYTNILYPELLYFSSQIFAALNSVEPCLLHLWWHFRTKVSHQRFLEDTSATLYSELELITAKLSNELLSLKDKPRLSLLLCMEIAQAYLIYGRVQNVEDYLFKAKELSGLKLELTGILGKRTKFQQKALPQLALSSELDSSHARPTAEESHGSADLPAEVELLDDVRLNKIAYNEKISQAELPSLEQTLCLLSVQYIQKAQPKDDLTNEEIQPYVETILSQKSGAWATRVAALLIRCKVEASHKRTVERAMQQCENIVNDKTPVPATARLSYLWANGLQPSWWWRQQLADLYLSLGLVKAALQEYEALQLWEDVVVCYTCLQLRHKAAEVIKQQLEVNPTVKLYCLLGDATDDVSCYEKAWEFSGQRSSRAQRHWGNFLFEHKKYDECIPHYEKSLAINSIQESVWLRLGYAALMTNHYNLSAKAYRRYTYLQPNSFEAWNNLAKVYVQQGAKNRAYRALVEALRFNYDNWKLWENVITVSMDTGHFEDVIRGVHRLLDLQNSFKDVEVLQLLVRAILQDVVDADGNSVARLRKRVLELFGRITALHQNNPEVWRLYADLSPTALLKAQRLLKAYRGYTQNGSWTNSPATCLKVIELTKLLLEHSLNARKEAEDKDKLQADQQLSSARLTGQAVVRAVENQDWPETRQQLEQLKELFINVTEYMKSIKYYVVLFRVISPGTIRKYPKTISFIMAGSTDCVLLMQNSSAHEALTLTFD